MENHKMQEISIFIESSASSKEAKELLKQCGYINLTPNDHPLPFWIVAGCNGYFKKQLRNTDNIPEITLAHLRDMAVLHRNDVNDATHTDQDNWKWYIGVKAYVWQDGNANQELRWDESLIDHVDLIPITKKPLEEHKDLSRNSEVKGYKFNAKNDEEALEAIQYFKNLGYKLAFDLKKIGYVPHHLFAGKSVITWLHNDPILYKNHDFKEISLAELKLLNWDYLYNPMYKIVINGDKGLANEVRSLIAEIGLYADGFTPGHNNYYGWEFGRKSCSVFSHKVKFSAGARGELITIEELRNMAFLKRNTGKIPEGATFATLENGMLVFRKDGYFWEPHDIIASDGGPEWVESSVTINNATACNLNVVWKQIIGKEYLNTSTHKAEIFINPPTPAEEWLEIPEGATFATGCIGIVFRKDGFYWRDNIFMKEKDEAPHWQSTAVTQNCIPPMMSVIWTRNTESLNDIAKTAEDHRKKLIAAGRQTGKTEIIAEHLCPELGLSDFGTGIFEADTLYHYSASYSQHVHPKDGVIAFDGRISSKADYEKIRELIFADMNESRKEIIMIQSSISDLIVHSLTVVG